jgi:hypothetical protein
MMDSILIGSKALDGIKILLDKVLGPNDIAQPYMEVRDVLLVIEIMSRACDRVEYFPHGKWGTIQALQDKIDFELDKIKRG